MTVQQLRSTVTHTEERRRRVTQDAWDDMTNAPFSPLRVGGDPGASG